MKSSSNIDDGVVRMDQRVSSTPSVTGESRNSSQHPVYVLCRKHPSELSGESVAGIYAHLWYRELLVLATAASLTTMLVPPSHDPIMSVFEDGKLKPGKYKVQNLTGQTFLEILEDSKELCCRPATVLSAQDASVTFQNIHTLGFGVYYAFQWEFQTSGGLDIGSKRRVTATSIPHVVMPG